MERYDNGEIKGNSIWYTIETGIIGTDGNMYADDYIDSGTDQEGQVERYIDIELSELRRQAELDGDLKPGEVCYKKLTTEKQDEDGYILDTIDIDYEDENAPHNPQLTCMADLGDIDAIVEQIR